MLSSERNFFLLSLLIGGISANLEFFQEGGNATLQCTGEGDVRYWFLNGKGSAIDITASSNPRNDVYMDENGTLVFDNVSKDKHDGSHVCVTDFQETITAYNVRMNVIPLPQHNLWEAQYRGMFVTGLLSALICFALFAGFCLVKKYRYRDPLTKVQHRNLVEEAYVNPAMVDDNDQQFSVKM